MAVGEDEAALRIHNEAARAAGACGLGVEGARLCDPAQKDDECGCSSRELLW